MAGEEPSPAHLCVGEGEGDSLPPPARAAAARAAAAAAEAAATAEAAAARRPAAAATPAAAEPAAARERAAEQAEQEDDQAHGERRGDGSEQDPDGKAERAAHHAAADEAAEYRFQDCTADHEEGKQRKEPLRGVRAAPASARRRARRGQRLP